jgi:hypothetical protein
VAPKKLKPQALDTIDDRNTGRKVTLYLDRDTRVFYYEMDGERVEEREFLTLERRAKEDVKKRVPLQWEPRLKYDFDANRPGDRWSSDSRTMHREGGEAHLTFELDFERFEIARRPDGVLVRRKHDGDLTADERDERKAGKFDGTVLYSEKVPGHPYDERVWRALNAIFDTMVDAAGKIEKLMGDPKLLAAPRKPSMLQLPEENES